MRNFEVEDPPAAQAPAGPVVPIRVAEVQFQGLSFKISLGLALLAGALQISFQVGTFGYAGSAARSLEKLPDLLKAATEPPAGPSKENPTQHSARNTSDLEDQLKDLDKSQEPTCDYYEKDGQKVEMLEFQSALVSATTDFMTMWLDPSDDSEAYMEFELDKIKRDKPLEIGIAAVNIGGPKAHMDATLHGSETTFQIVRSKDESGIDFLHVNLRQRTQDASYESTFHGSRVPGLELRLKPVATRSSSVGPDDCQVTHFVVDAKPLIAGGFFILYPSPPALVTPQIEPDTLEGHPGNLDFSVEYLTPESGRASKPPLEKFLGEKLEDKDLMIRFCIFALGDKPMTPRVADDRVGYFLTEFHLIGDYRDQHWLLQRPEELINPTVRLINRQRIRKPAGTKGDKLISELGCAACVPGIHFYIDPTVPQQFHEATRRGVQAWRKAFAPLAADAQSRFEEWKDAGSDVVYAHAPGDETWPDDYDVADVRFNTISWTLGELTSASAIGQSVVDPRSGEILKANIVFELGWLEAWLGKGLLAAASPQPDQDGRSAVRGQSPLTARRLHVAPAAGRPEQGKRRGELPRETPARHGKATGIHAGADAHAGALRGARAEEYAHTRSGAACGSDSHSLRAQHPHEGLMCRALYDHSASLLEAGAEAWTPEEARQILEHGIEDVTRHEVGHTLGLRHNFQGSLSVTPAQATDYDWVMKNGLSASTMDYTAVNLVSVREREKLLGQEPHQGAGARPAPLFDTQVGAYDVWAIRYGYKPIKDEGSEGPYARHPELIAIASEYADAGFSFATDEDADDFDPYTRRFDLTSDPIWFHSQKLAIVEEAMETLRARTISSGEPWTKYLRGIRRLINHASSGAEDLTSFVGGLRASRRHAPADCNEAACAPKEPPLQAETEQNQERALLQIFKYLTEPLDGTLFPDVAWQGSAVVREDFYGIQPFDLVSEVMKAKSGVLSALLSDSRLTFVRINGDLRKDKAAVLHLLQRCSHGLLGVSASEADKASSTQYLSAKLDDPVFYDLYMKYFTLLAERTSSKDARVATAAESESHRLTQHLEELKKGGRHAGFVGVAVRTLQGLGLDVLKDLKDL